MPYHINDEKTDLEVIRKRIEATDLVPSRVPLLDGIDVKFGRLAEYGIATLADLRKELKNPGRMGTISAATGIGKEYLILLRREIESWFPKPPALKDFDWLPREAAAKPERMGIRAADALYEAAESVGGIPGLADSTGVEAGVLGRLVRLADLTRIQWVSPTTARMLSEAGYDSPPKVAAADPEKLHADLIRINADGRFYKGKIGLRDIKRLIQAAGYAV